MCVIDGVIGGGGPTILIVVIGPSLTQLDTCDPMVPSNVCSEGPVNVHAEDPHSVSLILVPLGNVLPMVVVKILHTLSIDTIEPAKLHFRYMRYEG
jgi:hypothetical protein